MPDLGSIVIALRAVDEASSVMDKVRASTSILANAASQLGGPFEAAGNIMQGFAGAGVAGAVITAAAEAAKGLQECIKAATASEAVWSSLGAAVERSGQAWEAVKKGTEDALLAMSKTTTYSDEQLAQALEKLLTFGLSYDEAMKALGQTIDFAAAKHMDLESAATIVGKAMDGNTAILKRYGVDVATSKDQVAALKDVQEAAAAAIKAMGDGISTWVTNVTAAIGADAQFEQGLTSAKDKAAFLIEQFKQGAIDTPQFTAAMQSLGVPLDEAAVKGGSAAEVLAKLNEQFGGAAQSAASTYAGIQERLNNATGEVSEKIGMIFLPALASITEAFIPVVDWLGQGVDAISAWLTEVGKMPEVQGIVAAVQDAFGNWWKGLQDLWNFLVDTFGPVLQELIGAFREIWDALQPAIDAVREVWDAIFGGMDTGDWFKDFLKLIALFIREEVVPAIKAAVPVIRELAEGFKTMADMIVGPIETMKALIIGFLDGVRRAFQDFYNWLVGHSLWRDLWDTMVRIASGILPGFVQMMLGIFSSLSGALGGIWNQMQTAFGDSINRIRDTLTGGWETIKANAISIWDEVAARSTDIMTRVQTDLTGILTNISRTFTDSFGGMRAMFDSIVGGIQDLWSGAWNNIARTGADLMRLITGDTSGFAEGETRTMYALADAIATSAAEGWNAAAGAVQQGLATAGQAISGFWNWLVGGSVWQEGLNLLIRLTDAKMTELAALVDARIADMRAAYSAAMGSPTFGGPMMPEAWLGAGGAAAPTRAATAAAAPSPVTLNPTIPITSIIQVDGETVMKVVERRIIEQHYLCSWRSA